ncbi:hypothetical protein NIES4106_32680 [Fischerella sp. NIES-4106]|jgi:hypothetical protein|nr:hypothetical protein NIES4106_32680 [Fischerella sp. NIES-4106]
MEPLQKQVLSLSYKLDALYQVIEQLDNKVSQALSVCSLDTKNDDKQAFSENSDASRFPLTGHINLNPEMEHKDVIADGVYPDSNLQGGDRHIAPEIQIQRLTAQLTAAYNRIAALEEQLLLKRIH